MTDSRRRLPADKEAWSEKSRSGVDYVLAPDFYDDLEFSCRRCGNAALFSAEQQKYTYEVEKAYIGQRRVLCDDCFQLRVALVEEASKLFAEWKADKRAMLGDAPKLSRWLDILASLPSFGLRPDTARVRMLTRILRAGA